MNSWGCKLYFKLEVYIESYFYIFNISWDILLWNVNCGSIFIKIVINLYVLFYLGCCIQLSKAVVNFGLFIRSLGVTKYNCILLQELLINIHPYLKELGCMLSFTFYSVFDAVSLV